MKYKNSLSKFLELKITLFYFFILLNTYRHYLYIEEYYYNEVTYFKANYTKYEF